MRLRTEIASAVLVLLGRQVLGGGVLLYHPLHLKRLPRRASGIDVRVRVLGARFPLGERILLWEYRLDFFRGRKNCRQGLARRRALGLAPEALACLVLDVPATLLGLRADVWRLALSSDASEQVLVRLRVLDLR